MEEKGPGMEWLKTVRGERMEIVHRREETERKGAGELGLDFGSGRGSG